MGISGAVIYGLIVMAIREIAAAFRWAWQIYRDGLALYGASYYGMPHVTGQESKGMAAPCFQPAMRTDWPLKSIGRGCHSGPRRSTRKSTKLRTFAESSERCG